MVNWVNKGSKSERRTSSKNELIEKGDKQVVEEESRKQVITKLAIHENEQNNIVVSYK